MAPFIMNQPHPQMALTWKENDQPIYNNKKYFIKKHVSQCDSQLISVQYSPDLVHALNS